MWSLSYSVSRHFVSCFHCSAYGLQRYPAKLDSFMLVFGEKSSVISSFGESIRVLSITGCIDERIVFWFYNLTIIGIPFPTRLAIPLVKAK